ncbi:MAG: YbaK/EbsC family protein [Acidimicrobiales bacterium]|jgi:prolyl-tRNA editing enzyme YbaK/EbsC (Cys-tRNA(Pro) deacylase)
MSSIDALHPSARKVAEALVARGVEGPFIEFEASTKSAADAARALECDVGAIASCLVFVLDDDPIVIIKSGASRVDTQKFATLSGGELVRQATPDEVRAATGQPIGGVSPVNWPGDLRVFIDDSLVAFEKIWAACGTPNAVFATSFIELRNLTNATVLTMQ